MTAICIIKLKYLACQRKTVKIFLYLGYLIYAEVFKTPKVATTLVTGGLVIFHLISDTDE